MAPRYTIRAWNRARVIFEDGTEEPEAMLSYVARVFPHCRITLRDEYSGETHEINPQETP